ncbi:MAG: DUF3486 family protein [Magnetococcales bacterium]|nr:DUF3486 family protein [Magnetococcales bacterium]
MPARKKVAALPEDVRAWLDEALRSGNYSGYELLEQELKGRGYDIGKSSLQRHGRDLQKKLEAMQAATQWAKDFVAQNGDTEGVLNEATLASLQADAFRLMLSLREVDEQTDPEKRVRILTGVSNAMANVVRSSVMQKRWRQEISAPNLEAARSVLEKLMGFVEECYPQHASSLLEILEPFGETLTREFAS